MGKQKISAKEIEKIVRLRKTGHTISEIKKTVQRGNATIFRYSKNVLILPKYRNSWKMKQGGGRILAKKRWDAAQKKANSIIPSLNTKEKIIIAACLYWGEGTKKDFSLSNTDPALIQTFVTCLRELGISLCDLRVTIRIYEDLDKQKAIEYWAAIIGIPKKNVLNVNILKGKKSGKLPYGMCRVRVTKGTEYLKLLQSAARTIARQLAGPRSSTDRTEAS